MGYAYTHIPYIYCVVFSYDSWFLFAERLRVHARLHLRTRLPPTETGADELCKAIIVHTVDFARGLGLRVRMSTQKVGANAQKPPLQINVLNFIKHMHF